MLTTFNPDDKNSLAYAKASGWFHQEWPLFRERLPGFSPLIEIIEDGSVMRLAVFNDTCKFEHLTGFNEFESMAAKSFLFNEFFDEALKAIYKKWRERWALSFAYLDSDYEKHRGLRFNSRRPELIERGVESYRFRAYFGFKFNEVLCRIGDKAPITLKEDSEAVAYMRSVPQPKKQNPNILPDGFTTKMEDAWANWPVQWAHQRNLRRNLPGDED